MKLSQWLFIGVNLGLLPGLALAPGEIPGMNMKTAETALYMQMWGNFSNEQKANEKMEETAPGTGAGGNQLYNTDTKKNGQTVEVSIQDNTNPTLAADTESNESPGTEAVNEQTAGDETVERAVAVTEGTAVNDTEDQSEETIQQTTDTPVVESTIPRVESVLPLYTVAGAVLDPGIQEYLYTRLAENGIPWFMPYAVLIAYGESRFNTLAENPNGRDKGLFQYRVEYVPWMNWQNPYEQIDYFVAQMANRANVGCTVSDMISRHNVSDYGSYNQGYVDYIMSEAGNLVQIR